MNKLDQAAKSLEEAANLLDELPDGVRWKSIFGPFNDTSKMREEARYLRSLSEVSSPVAE